MWMTMENGRQPKREHDENKDKKINEFIKDWKLFKNNIKCFDKISAIQVRDGALI